jgi:hypothetical protein
MRRTSLAMLTVLAIVACGTPAFGQPCEACGVDLLGAGAADVVPAHGPSRRELEALLAAGAALAVSSYAIGVVLAHDMPHSITALDGIPVVGPIVEAARHADDRGNASLLVLTGGIQAIGILILAASGTELAERRRIVVDVSAGPGGCGASMTWRFSGP